MLIAVVSGARHARPGAMCIPDSWAAPKARRCGTRLSGPPTGTSDISMRQPMGDGLRRTVIRALPNGRTRASDHEFPARCTRLDDPFIVDDQRPYADGVVHVTAGRRPICIDGPHPAIAHHPLRIRPSAVDDRPHVLRRGAGISVAVNTLLSPATAPVGHPSRLGSRLTARLTCCPGVEKAKRVWLRLHGRPRGAPFGFLVVGELV